MFKWCTYDSTLAVIVTYEQVLRRGANVNDRDDLTDLTLLHYACKSGAGESMSSKCVRVYVGVCVQCSLGM